MWELVATIAVPIIKWIFERIAKKKLNEKEFIEYVRAHQKLRGRAGQTAVDWEEALAQARKELAEEQKAEEFTASAIKIKD